MPSEREEFAPGVENTFPETLPLPAFTRRWVVEFAACSSVVPVL